MTAGRHVVVMITTSYPRFAGDGIGSFIAPIAKEWRAAMRSIWCALAS